MATDTTVRVKCDHCGEVHYEGPLSGRPKHADITFWRGTRVDWDPKDLCEACAEELEELLDDFGRGRKTRQKTGRRGSDG